MSFVRQPILTKQEEEQLKADLSKLWREGYTASKISKILGFGITGTIYEKLKPYHVYFYRQKFGFRKRQNGAFNKGESRYRKKITDTLTFEQFQTLLNSNITDKTFFGRRMRAYLILHYWTPLRKSEIYERKIDDFENKKGFLIIHLLRKKKKHKLNVKDEPLSIPLALPLMDEVVKWLEGKEWFNPVTNPNNRPFNFSYQTAWNYAKKLNPDFYPHYFRFNWITEALNDPETTITELISKTGLHVVTVNNYIMSSLRFQTGIDQRKLEKLKEVIAGELPSYK